MGMVAETETAACSRHKTLKPAIWNMIFIRCLSVCVCVHSVIGTIRINMFGVIESVCVDNDGEMMALLE